MTNYFNPFSTPYQNNFYPTNNTQKYSNKIYVSGIEGARSYPLNPNSEVLLCDDTNDIVYDILVDPDGKRTINVLDVKQHEERADKHDSHGIDQDVRRIKQRNHVIYRFRSSNLSAMIQKKRQMTKLFAKKS